MTKFGASDLRPPPTIDVLLFDVQIYDSTGSNGRCRWSESFYFKQTSIVTHGMSDIQGLLGRNPTVWLMSRPRVFGSIMSKNPLLDLLTRNRSFKKQVLCVQRLVPYCSQRSNSQTLQASNRSEAELWILQLPPNTTIYLYLI